MVDSIDFSKLRIRRLTSVMNVSRIDCTDAKSKDTQGLQEFLRKYVLKHQIAHLGMTYVIFYKRSLIAFITLATAHIHKDNVIRQNRPTTRTTPYFPAIIVGYFGVDKQYQSKHIGTFIIKWSIGLARTVSKKIGIRYVILFAREALGFYQSNNFQIAEMNEESCPHCGKILKEIKEDDFKLMYADIFPETKLAETTKS